MKTAMNKNILIIDDEKSLCSSIAKILAHHGYQTTQLNSKKEIIKLPQHTDFDLAILDLKLPDGCGLHIMDQLRKKNPGIQVIIMTGYGTIDLAVEATKKGAFHFITKPFNLGEIVSLTTKALSQSFLETENSRLRACVKKQYCFNEIIGQSPAILKLIELIKKIALASSTILITGESGTGKELIAKSIHFNSDNSHGPFIPVHCGAIPKDLLESELFGHVKGSFTGAIRNRVGHFQAAEGGTLFLDEVSTMDLSTQIKLLRVLQEKQFQPVGSEKMYQSNVRVIAASNENLESAVKKGTFRKDLFYRLNVIPVFVPPLRQRKEDIPILINFFIKELRKNKSNVLQGICSSATEHLCHYDWPGNIRELENLIERLCVLKAGQIVELEDLPIKYHGNLLESSHSIVTIPESGLDFKTTVDHFENELILKALEKTKWNRNQAAKLLKLNRTTLLEKIKKKGLNRNRPDADIPLLLHKKLDVI